MRQISVVGTILALFFLVACTPSPQVITTEGVRGLPDLRLGDAQYRLKTDDEHMPIVVQAAEIAIFNTREHATLSAPSFWRADEDGTLLFSGRADSAHAHTTNYDTTLSGSVEILDHQRELTIYAEQLLWLHDLETLVSEGDELILVVTVEGEEILGTGLTLHVTEKTLSFKRVIHGVVGL